MLSITVYRRGNQYNVKVADPESIRTKRSGKYLLYLRHFAISDSNYIFNNYAKLNLFYTICFRLKRNPAQKY